MKIEKNVPMPENHAGKFTNTVLQMEEGDSVLLHSYKEAQAFCNCIARKHPLGKGSIRAQRNGSYRVWRIS